MRELRYSGTAFGEIMDGERLCDPRRCLAVDLLGHGGTRAHGTDMSFGALAAMLAAFCDALGLDRLPGARDVVEVQGGKRFFPEERPEALTGPARAFWGTA